MNIRKADFSDLDAIARIYEDIHTAEENGLLSIGWKRGVYPTRETAEASIRRGDMFVLEDGEVIGAAIINRIQVDVYDGAPWENETDKVCVLHTLVISPRHAGKGYGKAFVDFYEKQALQQGLRELRMDTNARNKAARSLYRKLGYKEIAIVPTVFNGIPGVDLVLLEKKLPAPKQYIMIDLKSFYASVEARELGLDPLTTNLVVADASRTTKTICLAVSPSLKSYGIPGRPRLFEVVRRVDEVNRQRLGQVKEFTGESCDSTELAFDKSLKVSYITATPRMSLYIQYSTRIYQIYLKYVAPEDIHVYSIDEVMIDATDYLAVYGLTAHELAMKMMKDVLQETGITATAGIGPNLFLAKVAMDIQAKHTKPDQDGVRIAELDEISYRRKLWDHRPLTDFWRVGRGYARKLEAAGLFTMGDIARCSLKNEDILYRMFGVNAELLIDHAWGWEPCTIREVKAYVPDDRSLSSGQVLMRPYTFQEARVIVHEMADAMALDLVEKRMAADQVVLTVNFENLDGQPDGYQGEVAADYYGKMAPKHAHGSENLSRFTSSGKRIVEAALKIFDRTVDRTLMVRRITIAVNHVVPEEKAAEPVYEQMDLFTDYEAKEREEKALGKERKMQEAMLKIKGKFGKNAILKGVNFEEGATGRERNRQVGGHKA